MSKKEQAQEIFNKMTGKSRPEIIQAFVDQLDMTPNGAATYYANCKRAAGGGAFNITTSSPKGKSKDEKDGRADNRTLYTICKPSENEFHEIVVGETHSYFNAKDAKKNAGPQDVVVKGLPEIDSNWADLKPI